MPELMVIPVEPEIAPAEEPVVAIAVVAIAEEREVEIVKDVVTREPEATAPERERVPCVQVRVIGWRRVICYNGRSFVGVIVFYYGRLCICLVLGIIALRARLRGRRNLNANFSIQGNERLVRSGFTYRQFTRVGGCVNGRLDVRYNIRSDRKIGNPAALRGYTEGGKSSFRIRLSLLRADFQRLDQLNRIIALSYDLLAYGGR